MTKKQWLYVGVSGIGALAVALLFFWLDQPSLTKANFERLRHGMSRKEVEAIVGPQYQHENLKWNKDRWIGFEGCAILHFDADDPDKLAWREWDNFPRRRRFPVSALSPVERSPE